MSTLRRGAAALGLAMTAMSVGAQDEAALPGLLEGHGGPIKSITIADDGTRVLTTSFDYSLILWEIDRPEAQLVARMTGHDGAVNDAAFLPDGRRAVSVGDDGDLILWDLETAAMTRRLAGAQVKVEDVAVSGDGRLAAAARWDGSAILYDLPEGRVLHVLDGHRGPVSAVAFAADGRTLYTAATDGEIRAWDTGTGRLIRPVHRHGWGINSIARLADGRLAFGALDGTAGLVDPDHGELVPLVDGDTPIQQVKVSQDGRLIGAADSEGRVSIFTAETGALVEVGHVTHGPVWDFDFLPGTAILYHVGLDDFAAPWRIRPRDFSPIRAELPRRFQIRDSADPGELEFLRKCSICHTLTPGDGNRAGPTLHGVFGREAGSLPGYPFSDALTESRVVWDETTIAQLFDDGPDVMLPGTKMPVQRLTSVSRRDALIRFLKTATAPVE